MKKSILAIACSLSIILFIYYVSGNAAKVTHGFASYYTFSRLLLEEKDFSISYDTAYFNSKIKEFGIDGVRDLPNNIPTSSLFLVPLAKFQPSTSKLIWLIINVIIFFAAILVLSKIFVIRINSEAGLALLLISFLFLPIYHGLALGQVYVFLLLLFVFSMYGIRKDNLWLTSIPLALMFLFKGYGVFPLFALAVLRKWKAVLAVFTISAFIILISIPIIGVDAWKVYINSVLLKMGDNEYSFNVAYQTANSFTGHVLHLNFSFTKVTMLVVIALLLVFISLQKKSLTELEILIFYGTFAAFNVIFAPLAEDYHYALALPLVLGAGKVIIDNYGSLKIEAVIFAVSLLLLSVPFNYKVLNDASFPVILLAYPRLYGGAMLVFLFMLLRKNKLFNELSLSRKKETARS